MKAKQKKSNEIIARKRGEFNLEATIKLPGRFSYSEPETKKVELKIIVAELNGNYIPIMNNEVLKPLHINKIYSTNKTRRTTTRARQRLQEAL